MWNETKIEEFTNWIIRHRFKVLLISLLVTVGIGYGSKFIGFDNNHKIYFSPDNPELIAQEKLNEVFNDTRNIFIGIEATDGSIFSKENLQALRKLEQESWSTPFSIRVDAISNFQHTHAEGDDILIESLMPEADDLTPEAIRYMKEIALSEEVLVGRLVSTDGKMAGINITVETVEDTVGQNIVITNYVRSLCQNFEQENPHLKTYITGQAALSTAFNESSKKDGEVLIPIMLLVIIVCSLLTTRSVYSALITLLILIASVVVALGLTGFLGIKFNALSFSAPTIIMTLGIANSIHILVSFLQAFRSGQEKKVAIQSGMAINFKAILFTSITTIIGFLVLNLNDSPPFHDLGNISALGVLAALLFSVFTLPALIAITPFKANKDQQIQPETHPFFDALAAFVVRRRKAIIPVFVFLAALFAILSFQNEFNDEFTRYFSKQIEFRSNTDKVSEHMTGIYDIQFGLSAKGEGGITDVEYLSTLNRFDTWLKKQPHVTHVLGIHDVVKRVNRSMHGDDPAYKTIPESTVEATQYLLMYEMSVPFGLDLNNQINMDKSKSKFSIIVENISSRELLQLTSSAERWLEKNAPEYMHAKGISTPIMFAHLGNRQINGMIKGGLLALVIISIFMMLLLKDVKTGIMSLIPNVIPVFMAFGVWFLIDGQVNSAVAMVFGMTLGIVVDDTVHIIVKYTYARKKLQKSKEESLVHTLEHTGRAVIATSVILIAGFAVLGFSNFTMNSAMGIMTAIVIFCALILDLLLLPALLISIKK